MFSFLYKALKDEIQFNKNCLVAYKETILAMWYIDVVADNHEDAYTVFEILNVRGQPFRYKPVNDRQKILFSSP